MNAPAVIVVSPEQLEAMIERAVRRALDERQPAEEAEWLDVQGAAEILGVHRRTVAKLVAKKGLPAVRLGAGKIYRFRRRDVEAWLESQAA